VVVNPEFGVVGAPGLPHEGFQLAVAADVGFVIFFVNGDAGGVVLGQGCQPAADGGGLGQYVEFALGLGGLLVREGQELLANALSEQFVDEPADFGPLVVEDFVDAEVEFLAFKLKQVVEKGFQFAQGGGFGGGGSRNGLVRHEGGRKSCPKV